MRTGEGTVVSQPGRATVEWYFGDLVKGIARKSPLALDELIDALARLQASTGVRQLSGSRVAYSGPDETVVTLRPSQWQTLAQAVGLTHRKMTVAQETHRQMARALGVEPERAVPVVLVDANDKRDVNAH